VTHFASKRLLLIAFHFPPLQGSTGLHRSLAFARYLVRHGWEVTVLTATQVPTRRRRRRTLPWCPVTSGWSGHSRSTRSDTSPYSDATPASLAVPDQWRSWVYSGVRAGRRGPARLAAHAILSTFPIPSAHEIALRLCESSSLPGSRISAIRWASRVSEGRALAARLLGSRATGAATLLGGDRPLRGNGNPLSRALSGFSARSRASYSEWLRRTCIRANRTLLRRDPSAGPGQYASCTAVHCTLTSAILTGLPRARGAAGRRAVVAGHCAVRPAWLSSRLDLRAPACGARTHRDGSSTAECLVRRCPAGHDGGGRTDAFSRPTTATFRFRPSCTSTFMSAVR